MQPEPEARSVRPAPQFARPEPVEGSDYARIARVIATLDENPEVQPSLDELASSVGLSPFHFQRLFQRWAGVSPKAFLKHLTLARARRLLAESTSVLETSHAVGLSGGGRLHDLFVTVERMTPGEFSRGGAGLAIAYGVHETPFGDALFAATPRGLCALSFVDGDLDAELGALRARWPNATLVEDPLATARDAKTLNERIAGRPGAPLSVLMKGTPFQLQVWEALLRIPEGAVVSYQSVAAAVGRPDATRAVASAVGANPLAWLIPCHRVLRATGAFGGYRWGLARKQVMLARERGRCPSR